MPPRKPAETRPLPAIDFEQAQAAAFLPRIAGPARRATRERAAGPSLFGRSGSSSAATPPETGVPSLLFAGPEGTGREYAAVEFARTLCCEHDTPCSLDRLDAACTSCRRVALWEHPGIHFVYPTPTQGGAEKEDGDVSDIAKVLDEKRLDAFAKYRFSKKASIRIARARATIARAASKPFESPFDVFIFNDAHAMREEAQNALLKLVEEPPPHVAIVFITSNPEGVLYTIRSRCQQVRFHPLKTTVLESVLREYYDADAKSARRGAAMAQGSLVRAREMTERYDDSDREAAIAFVEGLTKGDRAWAVGQGLAGGRGANRESVARFLDEVSLVLRDVMAGDRALYVNADLARRLDKLVGAWPRTQLPAAINDLYRARHDIFVRNTTIDATLASLFCDLHRRTNAPHAKNPT